MFNHLLTCNQTTCRCELPNFREHSKGQLAPASGSYSKCNCHSKLAVCGGSSCNSRSLCWLYLGQEWPSHPEDSFKEWLQGMKKCVAGSIARSISRWDHEHLSKPKTAVFFPLCQVWMTSRNGSQDRRVIIIGNYKPLGFGKNMLQFLPVWKGSFGCLE